jgi:hypothetical protein
MSQFILPQTGGLIQIKKHPFFEAAAALVATALPDTIKHQPRLAHPTRNLIIANLVAGNIRNSDTGYESSAR